MSQTLLYAGFVNPKVGIDSITASKPAWKEEIAILPTKQLPSSKWTIHSDDLDEYVDQDSLLENDFVPIAKKVSDCGTGSGLAKKACADCSCGLADPTNTSIITSACGSVCFSLLLSRR